MLQDEASVFGVDLTPRIVNLSFGMEPALESAVDAWKRACWLREMACKPGVPLRPEVEATLVGSFTLPEGRIDIFTRDDFAVQARMSWDHGYGERLLAPGPYLRVTAEIREHVRHGVPFGPAYRGGPPLWQRFSTDDSYRQAVAFGELRIRSFPGACVLLFAHDGSGVSVLSVGSTVGELQESGEVLGEGQASPRLMVRARGRMRMLQVSTVPGVLAHCALDSATTLLLLPQADRDVTLVVFDEDAKVSVTVARFSLDALIARDLLWSDEARHGAWTNVSRTVSAHSRVEAEPEAEAVAARARSSARATTGASASKRAARAQPAPGWLMEMVKEHLDELAPLASEAKAMCDQVAELLVRLLESGGVDIRGTGVAFRRKLEAAARFALKGSARSFRYAIAWLLAHSRLIRRGAGHERILPLSELSDPQSELVTWLQAHRGSEGSRVSEPESPPTATPHRDEREFISRPAPAPRNAPAPGSAPLHHRPEPPGPDPTAAPSWFRTDLPPISREEYLEMFGPGAEVEDDVEEDDEGTGVPPRGSRGMTTNFQFDAYAEMERAKQLAERYQRQARSRGPPEDDDDGSS